MQVVAGVTGEGASNTIIRQIAVTRIAAILRLRILADIKNISFVSNYE